VLEIEDPSAFGGYEHGEADTQGRPATGQPAYQLRAYFASRDQLPHGSVDDIVLSVASWCDAIGDFRRYRRRSFAQDRGGVGLAVWARVPVLQQAAGLG
jgi:hypothetical protein